MNRRTLRPELFLKFCNGKIGRARENNCKTGSWARDSLDLLEVIEMIGRNVNRAISLERDINRTQEFWRHDSAPMMAAFRPWIGKQEIKRFDGPLRQQIANGVETFDVEKANILESRGFAAGFLHAAC